MGTLVHIDNHERYQVNAAQRRPHGLQCVVVPFEELVRKSLDKARRRLLAQVNAGETNLHISCWNMAQAQQLRDEVDKLIESRGYTTTTFNVAQRTLRYSYHR